MRLPRSFLPFFSFLEKHVFGALVILYPFAVLVKKNLGNIAFVFVLLCFSGVFNTLANPIYFLDTIIVFTLYTVGFLGIKMVIDSHKYVDNRKKAWDMMGLGFMVTALMWFCLQLLASQLGVVT